MPQFECENCHVVENTALGIYWSRNMNLYPPEYEGKMLCSQCGSPVYNDGKPTHHGIWHNKFPRRTVEEYLKLNPNEQIIRADQTRRVNNG